MKSSLSSVGVIDADNELTVINNNDVFSSEDEALLIGDCKLHIVCIIFVSVLCVLCMHAGVRASVYVCVVCVHLCCMCVVCVNVCMI